MEKFRITLNGQSYEVEVERLSSMAASPVPSVSTGVVPIAAVAPSPQSFASAPVRASAKTLAAPMPGKVVAVNFTVGAFVKKGEVVLILEAMKMQNEILATDDGQVVDVRVHAGQTVRSGEPLISFG